MTRIGSARAHLRLVHGPSGPFWRLVVKGEVVAGGLSLDYVLKEAKRLVGRGVLLVWDDDAGRWSTRTEEV